MLTVRAGQVPRYLLVPSRWQDMTRWIVCWISDPIQLSQCQMLCSPRNRRLRGYRYYYWYPSLVQWECTVAGSFPPDSANPNIFSVAFCPLIETQLTDDNRISKRSTMLFTHLPRVTICDKCRFHVGHQARTSRSGSKIAQLPLLEHRDATEKC